jgi:tRNA(Ile)-lysidine synthase
MHGFLPKNGRLVRPLMFLSRDEIQALINDNGFDYVEDSSNSSAKYARNKIRLQVVPHLKTLNPNLENTFESNLRHFRELEQLLELKVTELKAEFFVFEGDEVHLSVAAIKNLNPQRLLLFKLLQDYGFNETSIDDIIASLDKHAGRVFEAPAHKVILDRDKLIITPRKDAIVPVLINETSHSLTYGQYKLTLLHDDSPLIIKNNPLAVAIDTSLLVYPLMIRAWQQSDFFYPLGMQTRKKLSDFFINRKVPLHQKAETPILVNGNGDIIWIGGYQLDERYKVTDNTKKVTIFELFKV